MPRQTPPDYWGVAPLEEPQPGLIHARPASAGISAPSPAPAVPDGSPAEDVYQALRRRYQMSDPYRVNPQQFTIFTEQTGEGIIPKGNLILPPLETKDEIVMIQFRESFHSPALIIPDEETLLRVKFMTPYNVYGYICGCSSCFVRWYLAKNNGFTGSTAEWGNRNRYGKQMIGHLGSFTGSGAIVNIPAPRAYRTRL